MIVIKIQIMVVMYILGGRDRDARDIGTLIGRRTRPTPVSRRVVHILDITILSTLIIIIIIGITTIIIIIILTMKHIIIVIIIIVISIVIIRPARR